MNWIQIFLTGIFFISISKNFGKKKLFYLFSATTDLYGKALFGVYFFKNDDDKIIKIVGVKEFPIFAHYDHKNKFFKVGQLDSLISNFNQQQSEAKNRKSEENH